MIRDVQVPKWHDDSHLYACIHAMNTYTHACLYIHAMLLGEHSSIVQVSNWHDESHLYAYLRTYAHMHACNAMNMCCVSIGSY